MQDAVRATAEKMKMSGNGEGRRMSVEVEI